MPDNVSAAYNQPMMVSFQIISSIEEIQRQGAVLIPKPTFEVTYHIELMPDYEAFITRYKKEHGSYPPDYANREKLYRLFAEEIKQKMPQLPICKQAFELLGVINAILYGVRTFTEIGKMPVIDPNFKPSNYPVPTAFPPLPLRYHKSYDINFTMQALLTKLTAMPASTKIVNDACKLILENKSVTQLPTDCVQIIRDAITAILHQKLPYTLKNTPNFELETDEVEKITQTTASFFYSQINQLRIQINDNLNERLDALAINSFRKEKIKTTDHLNQKILLLKQAITDHYTHTKTLWEKSYYLSQTEILEVILPRLSEEDHETVRDNFTNMRTQWASNQKKLSGLLSQLITNQSILESNINTCAQLIAQQSAEIAKIPGNERNSPQAVDFINSANQNIFKFQNQSNEEQKKLNTIHQKIHELTQALDSIPKTFQERGDAFKKEGLRLLKIVYDSDIKELEECESYITQCSHKLSKTEALMQHSFSPKYTHSFLEFRIGVLDGKEHHYVGGTHIEIPTITTVPIEHGPEFIQALNAALTGNNLFSEFSFNQTRYAAFKVPVKDIQYDPNVTPETMPLQGVPVISVENTTPPLFQAIYAGDLNRVKQLVQNQSDPNLTLVNDLFPLYAALQNNQEDIALWLIDHVPTLEVDKMLENQMTALHLAIEIHKPQVAKALLSRNAKCDIKRKSDGFTALHCAVKEGNLELLRLMFSKGASLSAPLESGKMPMHLAAEYGQIECLDYLMTYSSTSKYTKTLEGHTPLMLAILSGQLSTALILAEKSLINICNQQDQTASLLALQYGMNAVADCLIDRGENPHLKDKKGLDSVYYIIRNGEYQRFCCLLQNGKLNICQQYGQDTLLSLAARYGQFLIVYELLEYIKNNIKNNIKDNRLLISNYNAYLIHYAVVYDEIGYLQSQHKVDALPLASLAAKHGSLRCLNFLVKNLKPEAIQAAKLLKISLESHNPEVVDLILHYYRDVNLPLDDKNNTALHLAVTQGSINLVELLLSRGANVEAKNTLNETPFHIALKQKDALMLKRLFKLSRPLEWPADLWHPPSKGGAAIQKVLKKYEKRRPKDESKTAFAPSHPTQTQSLENIQINPKLIAALKALRHCFNEQTFDEACDLLKTNPDLFHFFKSPTYAKASVGLQGSDLFNLLFANIFDNTTQNTQNKKTTKMPIDRLLALLKANNVNPVDFKGLNNVLLTIIKTEADKEADYRLKLLSEYFPESLVPLAMDSLSEDLQVIELALHLNKIKLFKSLEELHHQNHQNADDLSQVPFFPLHRAVKANQYELVQELLERHPVDSLNHQQQTPLMLAAAQNNPTMIELLLTKGADPNRIDIEGDNAFMYAILHKASNAALCLFPLIRDKNKSNRNGIPPICLAAGRGLLGVVRLLCEHGDYSSSCDNQGKNALHYAAFAGNIEIIDYLVEQGFPVDSPECPAQTKKREKSLKRTPLQLAAFAGKARAVARLLELGADPTQQDALENTVCAHAILGNNIETLETVQQLDLYDSPEQNKTLLFSAVRRDHIPALSDLILHDRTDSIVLDSGATPLHVAAACNSGKAMNLLLSDSKINLNSLDNAGRTPLHCAALNGHVRIIDAICQHPLGGTTVNYHNKQQPTALFLACENGHLGAVTALLKHKADPTIPNSEGITPMEIAIKNEHASVVQLLKEINKKEKNYVKF